jgi:hypothetical protein
MITITYILMMMAETQCYSDVRFFMTDIQELVKYIRKRDPRVKAYKVNMYFIQLNDYCR